MLKDPASTLPSMIPKMGRKDTHVKTKTTSYPSPTSILDDNEPTTQDPSPTSFIYPHHPTQVPSPRKS